MPNDAFTPEETAQLRQHILETCHIPGVLYLLRRFPVLQSAMVVVAQYWCDEADDEVHFELVFSELHTPDYLAWCTSWEECADEDPANLPSFGDRWESGWPDAYEKSDEKGKWPNLFETIPAFAAYCKEGGHQSFDNPDEVYTPYAILRRQGDAVDTEIVGTMLRPWLDGVKVEAG